ncbi:MAG: DUF1573 domain-containing protein [Candidatus Jettenia sp.]|uniref:DUF1573 domain-containing protein n=1 Tax=Candidatus Jettenia caeni TaxID=247490 RepID=I3IGL2_9BACT|nr:DUF1573 domain-containing protein [Candidatus Jettenia sp. AMX1]MBC6929816.1 DUF1573 domain-containing protein [Candidatus Jettenia sp.]WKZ15069.1 MAG: DUF1573 domain-containing protein [Candidatus Jettenia caeni]KAA0248750.1 MAG: DUF1573 domain-containing protein [Candidatus Jettenia sp. AMX1]MCE7881369.1 DUF1573 domain-containing protein [Candidatus Jettenia sp. AMX1]MCQ3927950.1 DUF1573 domain-containing protein [Candidatus Jettenia sp.]
MKQVRTYIIITFLIFIIKFDISIANITKTEDSNKKTTERPKIIFEEQVYDFGKIYIGENIKHGFKFKNIGSGELIIKNVKSSCGCTAALVSKDKLLNNEEGEVEIKFNPGHYVGKTTKSVVVNSNDPENPQYKLTITGEIIEEVIVNQKLVNFGIIKKGDTCTRSFEVKTIPELKTEIKKVESPNPYITITQNKINDNHYSYQVVMNKYDYIGRFTGIIFIYTNSSKQERIDIPFFGEIVGDVTFYPDVLSFGYIQKGQDVKKTVIVNFMNKNVKIEKIEIDPDMVNYQISELSNSKKIDVKLSKDSAVGKITGNLRIYTNSSIQPVITIPIHGEIRG